MALRAAYSEVGNLLRQAYLPFKYKRTLLTCHVQNRALSGLEAFIVSPTDGDALDSEVAGLCRLALRGKACRWDEDHRNVLSCLTSEQLFSYWKLLPTFLELRIRRLGWLQKNGIES